jgi:hypothetical protein
MYELTVSGITTGGQITVAVVKAGYIITPASKTVTVFQYTMPPPANVVDPTNRDIKAKFGASTVSAAFTDLHTLINDSSADFTAIIQTGDYIDLPSLTIGSDPAINDAPITPASLPYAGYEGRLLRLIVVGINSFNGINGNGSTPHVVFQFQNIPVTHEMNATDTNAGGYAASAMKTYLTGDFLTGLKSATGLTSAELWAPERYVANAGGGNETAADLIQDELWLPTEREMYGGDYYGNNYHSVSAYETASNQARLAYYAIAADPLDDDRKIKYDSANDAVLYWMASPFNFYSTMFTLCHDNSVLGFAAASMIGGCAPAFCVR